jgi:DNA-binding CsgD family transcriptional regulator/tetratricopeptide (TPR) repeat protein
VTGEIDALLEAGGGALKAGDWPGAEESYRAALGQGETGEALFGLGIARWWVGETQESLRLWERAYATFHKSSEPDQAVFTAVYLCLAFRMSLGNDAAARGWLARAASLVEQFELTAMSGWVLLCRAYVANDSRQPHEAEGCARQALGIARQGGDADLALCATSELGAALVEMGEIEKGAALLDQAMAGALAGEGNDLDTVVLISCRTITSCSRAADVKRAIQWIRAADDFHRRYGSTHLYTTCRTHHGSVLFAVGEWERAEGELQAALNMGGSAEPALHAEAVAKMAELRLAQGRLDDAARLLAGCEDQPATAYACASLQLARGAATAAGALVRRRLRDLDEDCLETAALLELLTEAEVAQGLTNDRAAHHGGKVGVTGRCDLVVAHLERAAGRALAAVGDAAAVEHLEKALSVFGRLEMPYECGRARLLIAQTVARAEPETAIAEGRAALVCFEGLGAARDADAAAALLRSIGVKAARTGPKGLGLLTKRELEVLGLLGEGLSNRDIAGRLFISRKTVEHHVASVLSKIGLSGRAEAAAYATRHLDRSALQ